MIEILETENKKLKDEINSLKYQLNVKDNENNKLRKQLNLIDKPKYNIDDIIVINFHVSDSSISYGIKCVKTDIFSEVEENFYKKFGELRNTNNKLIANDRPVLRFKTINENNIKDGDIIQVFKSE